MFGVAIIGCMVMHEYNLLNVTGGFQM